MRDWDEIPLRPLHDGRKVRDPNNEDLGKITSQDGAYVLLHPSIKVYDNKKEDETIHRVNQIGCYCIEKIKGQTNGHGTQVET